MTLKQFEKTLDQQLIKGLDLLGFSSGKKHIYHKSFENGKSGSILIEKTDRRTKNTWFVSVQILFTHNAIEQLVQEVANEFYNSDSIMNTVAEGLGYLTPENQYLTWDFTLGEKESKTQKTMNNLLKTVEEYAIPKMEQLCNGQELLRVMINHEIGLQITNRVKAPILQYLMGDQSEAYELATSTLNEIRPTPKDTSIAEPENYASPEEAFTFFRRDKDPRYYFNYKLFYSSFFSKIES